MKDERYDVVIVGAGHNGTTTAAYLAKCGLSICVLEERPECGGCQETCEPIAGVRIQPHAIANYGGSAPGWEQLELMKITGHQSSAHPGGLCLMAVGYNLMHILIEDGIAQPGRWWYPSPWYIPQEGKISADPDKRSK